MSGGKQRSEAVLISVWGAQEEGSLFCFLSSLLILVVFGLDSRVDVDNFLLLGLQMEDPLEQRIFLGPLVHALHGKLLDLGFHFLSLEVELVLLNEESFVLLLLLLPAFEGANSVLSKSSDFSFF